jgi:hypothetical protein
MFLHVVLIAALSAILVLCLFLPFLPGEYDGLAAALATMSTLFGVFGLLLVLPGLPWLLYEVRMSRVKDRQAMNSRKEFYFALAATICSLPVAAMVTIGSWVSLGSTAAVIVGLALAASFVWGLMPRLRRLKHGNASGFNPAPLYLVILPLVVVIALFAFSNRAKEFSRRRAIDNAQSLIDDIEAYRQRTGKYPESLHSEVEDYKPLLRGIKRFYYEPSGASYNVFFEQYTHVFGTQEFVVYNPQDQQEFTTHNQDLLRIEPSEIFRGYHAVLDAGRPHWKTFLFD